MTDDQRKAHKRKAHKRKYNREYHKRRRQLLASVQPPEPVAEDKPKPPPTKCRNVGWQDRLKDLGYKLPE